MENKKCDNTISQTQLVEDSIGWAIYYEKEEAWLSSAHGYQIYESPMCALVFKTKEEAQETLQDAKKYWDYCGTGKIVRAWIPVIHGLRREVEQLEKANTITPYKINDIIYQLESVIYELKDKK